MTTQDHTTVDFIAYDAAAGAVSLVLVEERPWGERGALLPDLQAKLTTYLDYVSSGQLIDDYPQTAGAAVTVELRCGYPPREREKEFIDIVVRKYFDPEHIGFSWTII